MPGEVVMMLIANLKRGAYQVYGAWSADMKAKLVRELREGGRVNVHPIIDETDSVLDGHMRIAAAEEAGWKEIEVRRVTGLSPDAKWRMAFGQEMRRAPLQGREARRKLVADALKKLSHRSDAYISTMLIEVSDKLVRAVREELVKAGAIPDHPMLLGLDGIEQPARKTRKDKSEDAGPQPASDVAKLDVPAGAADVALVVAAPAEKALAANDEQEAAKHEQVQADGAANHVLMQQPQAGDPPKQEQQQSNEAQAEKAKRGNRRATSRSTSPLEILHEPGRLVIKENALLQQILLPGIKSIELLHIWEPDVTNAQVTLNPNCPTLVVYCTEKK